MTHAKIKSQIIRKAVASFVKKLQVARMTREKQDFLSGIQADTFGFNRAVHDVVTAQDSFQFAWNVAGEAMIDFGLTNVNGLHFQMVEAEAMLKEQ